MSYIAWGLYKYTMKSTFYITYMTYSYLIRTLKWDSLFEFDEEMTIVIASIFFLYLLTNYFIKEVVFAITIAVGKNCKLI